MTNPDPTSRKPNRRPDARTTLDRVLAAQDGDAQAMQGLIDNGSVWHLEGSMGRAAMAMIDAGRCVLGEEGHFDYWGNYVPSRTEVKPGTKGSVEYAAENGGDIW